MERVPLSKREVGTAGGREPMEWYPDRRDGLVSWLSHASLELGLSGSTLAIAVGCMDRSISKRRWKRNRSLDLAVVCLLIASKYEEKEVDMPGPVRICSTMGSGCSKRSILTMERQVLESLSWKIPRCRYHHVVDAYLARIEEMAVDRSYRASRERNDLKNTASLMRIHALYNMELATCFDPCAVAWAILSVSMVHLGWDEKKQRSTIDIMTEHQPNGGDVAKAIELLRNASRKMFPEYWVLQELITSGFNHSAYGKGCQSPVSVLHTDRIFLSSQKSLQVDCIEIGG